jgi:hypothetical protein
MKFADSQYRKVLVPDIDDVPDPTQAMLLTLPEESYRQIGEVNGVEMTAIVGITTLIAHERHHLRILPERYRPLGA